MKGMKISRAYFEQYGKGIIESFPQYKGYMAAGLVGEGSECFGYDDQLSTDHDFGPAFCIWVPNRIFNEAAPVIQKAYDQMPKEFMGMKRIETAQGMGRVGVLSIENFYMKFTGLGDAPKDNLEWFRIPDNFLATASNGEVFVDNYGEFSRIRNIIKGFYPDDVLKKKLAARCVYMAQSGQYNYGRCMKRGHSQAAYLACGEFVRQAMAAIYLLNGKYTLYYKWMFKGAEDFTVLKDAVEKLKRLIEIPDTPENSRIKTDIIEEICVSIVGVLNIRGLTKSTEPFLQVQGEELMRSISDVRLANMHIMQDAL